MSNVSESAYRYFEDFLIGMQEEYDSLLEEIQMATNASIHDYESIGTRVGFLTVMQIIAENGNALLAANFEKLNDDELAFISAQPELFLAHMIKEAEEACGMDTVQDQVSVILQRDFAKLNAERILSYFEEGVEKAAAWLRKVIEVETAEETLSVIDNELRAAIQ